MIRPHSIQFCSGVFHLLIYVKEIRESHMKIPQVKYDFFILFIFWSKTWLDKMLSSPLAHHRILQQTIFSLGILNICIDSSRELPAEWTTYTKFQTLLYQVRNKPVLCVLFVCFIFSSFLRLLHVLKCASDWIFSWKQNQIAPKRAVRSGSIGRVNDKSRHRREIGYKSRDM